MKTLLVGINAKFIHSNPAIRYIQGYAAGKGITIHTAEYTINQPIDLVLDEILRQRPDLIGFSCYLWNIEMVKKLMVMVKQIRPETKILLGGPEVSYDTKELLEAMPAADYIISGEGEASTSSFVNTLDNQGNLEAVTGLTYRSDEGIIVNLPTPPIDMAEIPFIYEDGLEGLEHRILYYETSRGCPYKCQYCLSSIEKGVRFRPLEMVKKELKFFLDRKLTQVKLVDRTFNANLQHTLAIWQFLHENDNGVTNFHFEITADLLNDPTIEFLKAVRPGLFQFEVGVQSTHEPTILTVERKVDFDRLKERVLKVMAGGNIHMHLDLIAGLPKEDYKTFGHSFDDVMAIEPEQLQLGFLKVLRGSQIHRLQKDYGIIYRDYAPYEVLFTKEMSYEDLRKLKDIEELLETNYNSNQYATAIRYLMSCHDRDFTCFESMADYWRQHDLFMAPHNKIKAYELLYAYGITLAKVDPGKLAEHLKHDLCMREKPKKWPSFIVRDDKVGNEVRNFYQNEEVQGKYLQAYKAMNPKQISRVTHVETVCLLKRI
jgi:radical SAM superfamily enzyme YgiQ (UPF0313 family)